MADYPTPESIIVNAGQSKTSKTKTVSGQDLNIPDGYDLSDFTCPEFVDQSNRLNTDHSEATDSFRITQDDNSLIVERADEGASDWWMNLKFECPAKEDDFDWSVCMTKNGPNLNEVCFSDKNPNNHDILDVTNKIRRVCKEENDNGPESVTWDRTLAEAAYELNIQFGESNTDYNVLQGMAADHDKANWGENLSVATGTGHIKEDGTPEFYGNISYTWASVNEVDRPSWALADPSGIFETNYGQLLWNDVESIGCSTFVADNTHTIGDQEYPKIYTRCLYQNKGPSPNSYEQDGLGAKFEEQVKCKQSFECISNGTCATRH